MRSECDPKVSTKDHIRSLNSLVDVIRGVLTYDDAIQSFSGRGWVA